MFHVLFTQPKVIGKTFNGARNTLLATITALLWTNVTTSVANAQLLEDFPGNRALTAKEFVDVRCHANLLGTNYFVAEGAMYAQFGNEIRSRHLFNFIGVDISRCLYDAATDKWWVVSRKVSLYLDPDTGKLLRTWTNPLSNEELTVIHRSYDYQEFMVPESLNALVQGDQAWVSLDANLKIPNPLSGDPVFVEYATDPIIALSLSYKYRFPTSILQGQQVQATDVGETFFQFGPFEPWMKLGQTSGYTVINYSGALVEDFAALPDILKTLINERMPLYKEAPFCRLKVSNATSWTRFRTFFADYKAGKLFPQPAPLGSDPECK